MKVNKLLFLITIVLGVGFSGAVSAQPTVSKVEVVGNTTATVQGSLGSGVKLKRLDWAWSSANACFPGTQAARFTGNHVFYVVDLPPRSIMNITVKPKNDSTNLTPPFGRLGRKRFTARKPEYPRPDQQQTINNHCQ